MLETLYNNNSYRIVLYFFATKKKNKMKYQIPSLAHIALKRLVSQKSSRDYLKSVRGLITPQLRASIYTNLLQIDKKFRLFMPREAIFEQEPMTYNDYQIVLTQFDEANQFKKLKCYDKIFRIKLIEKDYTAFATFENKTLEEWTTFFNRLPSITDLVKETPKTKLVKQLVNQQPSMAVQIRPDLLELVDNVTVQLCIDLSKNERSFVPTKDLYEKIRTAVNETAESQLASIVAGLNNKTIKQPKSYYIDLYDPFKSKECIYEWVRRGEYFSALPPEFETKEVLFEILRLGNTEVFRWLPATSKLHKTPALCMECLDICPGLIYCIDSCEQTPEMRDLILSKSMEWFPKIAPHLQTAEVCWSAVRNDFSHFISVPPKMVTPDMTKYVIDQLCSMETPFQGRYFYEVLGQCIEKSLDLQWHLIKTNKFAHVINSIIVWLDGSVIDYIVDNYSIEAVIQPSFRSIVKHVKLDKIHALVLKHPQLIEQCYYNNIPVSEEMCVRALESCGRETFKYCLKTPKVIKTACLHNYDIMEGASRDDREKIIDMLFECPDLFPFACKYVEYLIFPKRPLSFRNCAIIFTGAIPDMIPNILDRLQRFGFWLLYKCFKMACYSPHQPSIRKNWRQNVEALGEVSEFNVETMALILSFDSDTDSNGFDTDDSDDSDDSGDSDNNDSDNNDSDDSDNNDSDDSGDSGDSNN